MARDFKIYTGIQGMKEFDAALSILYVSQIVAGLFPIYSEEVLPTKCVPYIPEKIAEITDFIASIQKPWAKVN